MAQQQAAHTEIPDDWVREFKENVAGDPTARGAWKEIEDSGLQEGALFLLWGYLWAANKGVPRMHRRTAYASGRIKAAMRAKRIAQTRTPKSGQNPDLFRERAFESHQDALNTEWPVPSANARTVGDELALVSDIKGREIPLEAARKAMVKAAGERSPVNRFHFLFLLQGYVAEHGVTLGIKRLIALAWCADPERFIDEGTLGRYLSTIPESVKDGILRDTLPTLPPPVPRKNKR
jgi:hypothetical protein